MLPRPGDIYESRLPLEEPEPIGEDYETRDLSSGDDTSLVAVLATSMIMIVGGVFLTNVSETFGVGVIVLGLLMLVASIVALSEADQLNPELVDDGLVSTVDDMTYVDTSQEMRMRKAMRKREVDEIVKEVKSTIKIRCRYCGMLNDEKSNKCGSCGGSL